MVEYTKYVVLVLLFSISGFCFASQDYKCVIERLDHAGVGKIDSPSFYFDMYIGKEFSVNRRTGIMSGALDNSFINSPIVVDVGSSDNSYKAVNFLKKEQGAGAGTNIYALTVNEYVETEKKPFIFLRNDEVFYGYCTHF